MSEYDWAEIKIGEASVVVRSNSNELDGFIGVSFAFSDDPEFRMHGKCGRDHKHTSKPAGTK